MSFSGQRTEKNAKSIGTKAEENDLLYKSATGDTYLKWFLSLKRSLPAHSSRHVQEHGMEVIEDTAAWDERFARRLQVAKDENNDFEKKALYEQKLARESAARTIFHLVPSKLSDEVKDLVEMSEEYRVLSLQERMDVNALLKLVKKTVSVGVAANPTYQCYLAMRHLFETVQKPEEDLRVYLERVRASAAAFDGIVKPIGNMMVFPDVILKRDLEQRGSSSRNSTNQRGLAGDRILSTDLEPEMPTQGWISPSFAVMVAINGLNGKMDQLKHAWTNKLVDPTCAGLEIPTTLDDLGAKINSWVAINKSLVTKSPTEVKATRVTGKKFKKTFKAQPKGLKPGKKANRTDAKKDSGPTCWHCGKQGHTKNECDSLKAEKKAKKSKSNDESESSEAESEKKARSKSKKGTQVKATQMSRTVEEVDARDQFVLYMTRVASEPMNEAAHSVSLLLDNCANESIIANVDLLADIDEKPFVEKVSTAYGTQERRYDGTGTLVIAGVGHRVYVDRNSNDNIVSYARLEAALLTRGCGIYVPRRRTTWERPIAAVIVDTDDRELLTVYFEERMARFRLESGHSIMVTEFGKTLSSTEMEKAKTARMLQDKLGYASMTAVSTMISRGSIVTSVKGRDLVAARDALGPSEIEMKAKQTRKKTSIKRVMAPIGDTPVEEQVLYADVMHTMGKEFLLAVAEPMHLVIADALPSGKGFTHKEITQSLSKVTGMLFEHGYRVVETHFDSAAKAGDLSKYPEMVVHPPGQHVAQAERAIRTIKEVLRGFVQARPWLPWWGRFAVEAVGAATMYLSLRHAKNSTSVLSPFQQLTGRTPIVDRDFKASFGDLVLVENLRDEDSKSDVTRPRVVEAIWLRPTFDDHGSALVLLLDTCVIVSRVLSSRIEWEGHQAQLGRLYEWAGAPRTDLERSEVRFTERGKIYNLLSCLPDPGADVEWEAGSHPENSKTLVGRTSGGFPIPSRVQNGVDVPVMRSGVVGVATTETAVAVAHADGQSSVDARAVALDTSTVVLPTVGSPEEVSVVGVKRKLTSDSVSDGTSDGIAEQVIQLPGSDGISGETHRDSPEELTLNISERGRIRRKSFKLLATEVGKVTEVVTTRLAKGMHEVNSLNGDLKKRANAALLEEIRNLIQDHSTLSGASKDDVASGDEILPVSVIVEDKAVNGKSVKDKARIIAGGHRQNKDDFRSLSTQTVNTESVFILLAIAAYEKRHLMVIDVKGAYLNADMSRPDGRQTFVKIDKQLAKLFYQVDPSLRVFASSDGTLILRLDKALYGCIQSSALWQDKLTETLLKMGFRISSYDACVAISVDGNVIVCFHVDDILVVGKDAKSCKRFKDHFGKYFTITSKEGPELDYLGIHIRLTESGIELSQRAMVAKLIGDVKGTANSPAAIVEDEQEPEDEQLLDLDEAGRYRSLTALALYLSKRTRPDILQAVNMLCRKAQNPSTKDRAALNRLLRYVAKTRNNVMILPATSLQIEAWIDASFATAKDRKSVTGAVIMIGGAVIWCKSGKQNIVTKSSFEAELVALSDMSSMVLWVSLFMRDLGFSLETPIIYQDNQSTMKVAETGPSTNPLTKHIDIRYMWLKEVIKEGIVKLRYASTEEMVADGLTKPLVGEKFYKFVESLNLIDGGRG